MATQSKAKAKQKKGKKKGKMILFVLELIVILGMIGVLYWVMNQGGEGPQVVVIDPEQVAIPEQVIQATEEGGTMHGYMNIALFGVDAVTDKQLFKGSRSDSTMIASINLDTGDIKLVSVYRDTYLNLGTVEELGLDEVYTDLIPTDDYYSKCNATYSYAGAQQAIKMLNMNLDMNITDFVTVGYKGLSKVIDGLGGVYVEVDAEELKHINNYQIAVADVLKCDYKKVTETGYQLLNGVQASAYCRIRQTAGSDFQRTARQREVLKSIEEQAKKADLSTLTAVFNDCIGDVYTSLKSEDILALLGKIADYSIVEEAGFPHEDMRSNVTIGAKGACIVTDSLVENVEWLHHFLFEDEEYTVSDTVKKINNKIASDVAPYQK